MSYATNKQALVSVILTRANSFERCIVAPFILLCFALCNGDAYVYVPDFALVHIHYFYPFYLIMHVCVYFYNSSCYV